MTGHKPRRLFTEGHKRKFLVIVDESPEGETALYYAARRAERTGGGLALLFVIQPAGNEPLAWRRAGVPGGAI